MSSTLFILDTLFSHLKGHVTHSCHKCGWMGSFTTQVFGHESFRPGQMEAPGKPVGQAALSIGPSGKTCKSLSTKFSQTPRRFLFFNTEKNHELRSPKCPKCERFSWSSKGLQRIIQIYCSFRVSFLVLSGWQVSTELSSWKVPGSAQFIGVEANFVALSHGIWKILMLSIASIFVPWLSCSIFQMTWWYLGSRLNQEIWVNLCEDSLSHIGWAAQEFNKGYDWLASDTPKQRTHT